MPIQAIAGGADGPEAEEVSGWLEMLSGELRGLGRERSRLREAAASGPQPVFTRAGDRLGLHSRTFFEAEVPDSVVVDLGEAHAIDRVALVPVVVDTPLHGGGAYGFPLRFRIEIAGRADFGDAEVVFDTGDEDFANPGPFPVSFPATGGLARYVRFTSLRHARNLEHFIWALGELVVLSGERNIAAGASVVIEAAPTFPPAWMPENLTDSESIAAIPMVDETSPTNGWLADQQRPVGAGKWVQLEWGAEVAIDEVRLIPARPTDMADTPGMGFPLAYRIEGRGADDDDWAVIFESPEPAASVRTSENPVIHSRVDHACRTLRIFSDQLPARGTRSFFALAEVEVVSGGKNVAPSASLSASDSFGDPRFRRWSLDALTDGYSSQYRLVSWPDYLDGIARRSEVMRDLDSVTAAYESLAGQLVRRVAVAVSVLVIGLTTLLICVMLTARRRRVASTRALREQIARDLHDDIGSNLGGIALISDAGAARGDVPEEMAADLREIRDIARASSESMRDIVWLVQESDCSVADLAVRMKAVFNRLAGARADAWREDLDALTSARVPLPLRRHLLLAFKEVIHNAVRHARAKRISVDLAVDLAQRRLRFVVSDDGTGFDVDRALGTGNGLHNLRRRAEQLGGDCEVRSSPDDGTVVRFEAPL